MSVHDEPESDSQQAARRTSQPAQTLQCLTLLSLTLLARSGFSGKYSQLTGYPDAGVMVDEFFNGIVMRDSTRGPAIKKLEMQRRLEKVQWHAASLRKPVHARKQVIYTILKAAGMSSRHPDRPSRQELASAVQEYEESRKQLVTKRNGIQQQQQLSYHQMNEAQPFSVGDWATEVWRWPQPPPNPSKGKRRPPAAHAAERKHKKQAR